MEIALASPLFRVISKAASVISRLLDATSNKRNFEVLANKVKHLQAILERLHTMGRPFQGALSTGVTEFSSALDLAEELVIQYGLTNRVERFFKASSLKGKFKSVYKRLKSAEQQLLLALSVEQRCAVPDGRMGGGFLVPSQGGTVRQSGLFMDFNPHLTILVCCL